MLLPEKVISVIVIIVYTEITLLSAPDKVFCTVILNSLKLDREPCSVVQCKIRGLRNGRSCYVHRSVQFGIFMSKFS